MKTKHKEYMVFIFIGILLSLFFYQVYAVVIPSRSNQPFTELDGILVRLGCLFPFVIIMLYIFYCERKKVVKYDKDTVMASEASKG